MSCAARAFPSAAAGPARLCSPPGFGQWKRLHRAGAATLEAVMAASRTKAQTIQKLLSRSGGVTIVQLQKATGWQPHSVRAALTRLRKKGHAIERAGEPGKAKYRITSQG